MTQKEDRINTMSGRVSGSHRGRLCFSEESLDLYVQPDCVTEGSFVINGEGDPCPEGYVTSSEIRMKSVEKQFAGARCEIRFSFDSWGAVRGEEIKGRFCLISNRGEYEIPYSVKIMDRVFVSSMGEIKNLFHFTNLARANWPEAVKLFYSARFKDLLTGNDRQYETIYRGFRVLPRQDQKLEEFLLHIRKKQPVTYTCDKENILLSAALGIIREDVVITRKGWGYTKLQIETDGEFLRVEKHVLTDDDFLGNLCTCPVMVDNEKLHSGYNYGKLCFYNEYVSLEIPVCVNNTAVLPVSQKQRVGEKLAELMRLYLLYGAEQMTKERWLLESEKLLDDLKGIYRNDPVYQLYRLHLLLTKERYQEAGGVLGRIEERFAPDSQSPEIWCYYLYLNTLLAKSEAQIDSTVETIRVLYRQNPGNWKIAWMYLCVDGELSKTAHRKWAFLEEQFEKGCRSPVWYMEAAALARQNAALLIKLTPFTLQVLNFMAKYHCLTDDCIRQIHYLAEGLKQYSHRMFAILKLCYAKKPDSETLRAICTLLIRGGKTGVEYACWYRMGIEKELWIIRLYEFYMLSLDMEKEREIPAAVLQYFSYNSQLPFDRKAYLYAYVVKNRNAYGELYYSYLPEIESFLMKSLMGGQMNKATGYLLETLFPLGVWEKEAALQYEKAAFLHEVRVRDKRIRHVVVTHERLKGELRCPVRGGKAYVPFYSGNRGILFETEEGNRFSCSVSYEAQRLFQAAMPKSGETMPESLGMLLYLLEHGQMFATANRENRYLIHRLLAFEEVEESCKCDLSIKLLRYDMDNDYVLEADEFLREISPIPMTTEEKTECVRYLIMRGMYEKAFDWVCRYGRMNLLPKQLMRMCSRLMVHRDFLEDEALTTLAYGVFVEGKYDENILVFLQRFYKGFIREMEEIRLACERFDVACHSLEERILSQGLFTGEKPEREEEIFERYVTERGDARPELVQAYLEEFSRSYVRGEKDIGRETVEEMKRRYRNNMALSGICRLAVLKYLYPVRSQDYSQEDRELIRDFVNAFLAEQGLPLPFFDKFQDICPQLACFHDRTVLEYRAYSSDSPVLHYTLKQHGQEKAKRSCKLIQGQAGIWVKGFVLFFGETVEYCITEGQQVTAQGVLENGRGEPPGLKKSRYSRVNRFVEAVYTQDYERAEAELEDCLRTEFFTDRLFTLK